MRPFAASVISPEHYSEPFKAICDGVTFYGHIPYSNTERMLIASPISMLNFLQGHGYEVLLLPEYEECRLLDDRPLSQAQQREKEAFEIEKMGCEH